MVQNPYGKAASVLRLNSVLESTSERTFERENIFTEMQVTGMQVTGNEEFTAQQTPLKRNLL
jgi:hypothetical protein